MNFLKENLEVNQSKKTGLKMQNLFLSFSDFKRKKIFMKIIPFHSLFFFFELNWEGLKEKEKGKGKGKGKKSKREGAFIFFFLFFTLTGKRKIIIES